MYQSKKESYISKKIDEILNFVDFLNNDNDNDNDDNDNDVEMIIWHGRMVNLVFFLKKIE